MGAGRVYGLCVVVVRGAKQSGVCCVVCVGTSEDTRAQVIVGKNKVEGRVQVGTDAARGSARESAREPLEAQGSFSGNYAGRVYGCMDVYEWPPPRH